VFSYLLLFATAGIVAIQLFRAIRFRLHRQRRRAFASFRAAFILTAGYMFVLLVVSMAGHQRELPTGDPQCFGDWCVSVIGTTRDNARALVSVTVRNQGTRRQLQPCRPFICILDLRGRRIAPRSESGPPLEQPLNPGETIFKQYWFDIPHDMQYPMIWIHEGRWVTRFLIGGGNSFLHRKLVTLLQ
jgi:hypothetical protein